MINLRSDTRPFETTMALLCDTIDQNPELHNGLAEYIDTCQVDDLADIELVRCEYGLIIRAKANEHFRNIVQLAIDRNKKARGGDDEP